MRSLMLVAGLALVGSVQAETLTYGFDKVHTQVHASVSHMGFSHSTAAFRVKDGSIVLDSANLAAGKVDVVIDASSLDLGDATWKEHVSAEKWFNVAAFPEIHFVSNKVEQTGEKTLTISGELTLKGTTQPVTLLATLNAAGPHPFTKKPALGFSATATFKRSDFGLMEYLPAVGDEVSVQIEVEASAP